MSVQLEVKTKRFIADSECDDLPRPGLMLDGAILTVADLPVGSTVLYKDTGKLRRWNGSEWSAAVVENTSEVLLSAILAELRDIKERIALATV